MFHESQRRKFKYNEIHNVNISATGTANHTPVIPINCGIINKPIIIKPNVLKKEIKADSLPLDNAVKIADENILKPEKRKLNTNIINPFIAILYTASFVPVNKRTKVFPFIKDNAKINNEPTKMKEIQILYIFFNP